MFDRLAGRPAQALGLIVAAAIGLAGCSSTPNRQVMVTPQGTVALDVLKVGMPEGIFKGAIMTFVPDPKGTFGGKTQYLSRNKDANGGQYVAQCLNGMCEGLEVNLSGTPVTKEAALATLKQLLPADCPTASQIELDKSPGTEYIEVYHFGPQYLGRLFYTDKSKAQVRYVSAWRQAAPAASPAPATKSP
jgi:hypothetical protein